MQVHDLEKNHLFIQVGWDYFKLVKTMMCTNA
jgi:hypothetical protein